jgi:hypothetical protein
MAPHVKAGTERVTSSKKNLGASDKGESNTRRVRHIGSPLKRDHIGGWSRTRWCSKQQHRKWGRASGVKICVLSAGHAQASHCSAQSLWTSEAAIMMDRDTKKDAHTAWKYTIIWHAMSIRLVEGGLARVAGQSCLAGPSVAPAAPKLRAPPCMEVW